LLYILLMLFPIKLFIYFLLFCIFHHMPHFYFPFFLLYFTLTNCFFIFMFFYYFQYFVRYTWCLCSIYVMLHMFILYKWDVLRLFLSIYLSTHTL
jgi:hypothetical protein